MISLYIICADKQTDKQINKQTNKQRNKQKFRQKIGGGLAVINFLQIMTFLVDKYKIPCKNQRYRISYFLFPRAKQLL